MKTSRLLLSGCLALPLSAALAGVPGIKGGEQMTDEISSQVIEISTPALRQEIERNPDLVLIDIRTPGEVAGMGGAIKAVQNVNIPRGWLEFRVTRHAQHKDTPVVVYCGANIRSPLAAYTLKQMGYTNVRNYSDGFIGWRNEGLPTE
jgi:rhodanese-related sulfurtransferase